MKTLTDQLVEVAPGIHVWSRAEGVGRPVVVVHGGLGLDCSYLERALEPLSEACRVVFVDLRGNGRSGRADLTEATLDDLADDVVAVLDAHGLGRAVVLGHSYGGFVALRLVLRHPERVDGLVLVGTGAAFDRGDAVEEQLRLRSATPAERRAFDIDRFADDDDFRRWLQDASRLYLAPGTDVGVLHDALADVRIDVGALEAGNRMLHGFDVRALLPTITAPALVCCGRHDFIMPLDACSRPLADGLSHGRLVVFEGSGHLPFLEEPEAFRAAVTDFVGSLA